MPPFGKATAPGTFNRNNTVDLNLEEFDLLYIISNWESHKCFPICKSGGKYKRTF